jgi:hypothetical protein
VHRLLLRIYPVEVSLGYSLYMHAHADAGVREISLRPPGRKVWSATNQGKIAENQSRRSSIRSHLYKCGMRHAFLIAGTKTHAGFFVAMSLLFFSIFSVVPTVAITAECESDISGLHTYTESVRLCEAPGPISGTTSLDFLKDGANKPFPLLKKVQIEEDANRPPAHLDGDLQSKDPLRLDRDRIIWTIAKLVLGAYFPHAFLCLQSNERTKVGSLRANTGTR